MITLIFAFALIIAFFSFVCHMISFLKSALNDEDLIFISFLSTLFQHSCSILFLYIISLSQNKWIFRQFFILYIKSSHFQQSEFYDLSCKNAEALSEYFWIEYLNCFFWAIFFDRVLIIKMRVSSFLVRLFIFWFDLSNCFWKEFFFDYALKTKNFVFVKYDLFIHINTEFLFRCTFLKFK